MALNRLYEFKSVLLTAFIFLFVFSLMSGFKSQFPSTLAKKSSDNVSALINKGLALDNLGNHIQAIQYYDKALAIDPNDVDALYNKGNALDSLGNHTQAISYYDKVLDIDPNDVDALYNKGVALAHLGNYTQAISYYDKVLAIDPNDVDALNNKEVALDHLRLPITTKK